MGTRTTLMPLWATIRGGNWLLNNSLLWDSYNTSDPAPVSNPLTADPGPGLSTVTDTENKLAISGRNMVCLGGKTSPAYGDPGIWLGRDNAGSPATQAVGAGKSLFADITMSAATTDLRIGLDADAAGKPSDPHFFLDSAVMKAGDDGSEVSVGTVSTSRTKLLQPQRSTTHGYHFIQDGTLLWTDDGAVTSPAYCAVSDYNAAFSLHDMALVDLTSLGFTNDFLDVTDTKTNPANGTALNCNANCHTNATFTHENTKFVLQSARFTDSNNRVYWQSTSAGALIVTEFYLGTPNNMLNAAAVFSDGVPAEVDMVLDGSSIKVYVDKVLKLDDTLDDPTTTAAGYVENNLATNDIVLTTHPNPALGIATDRVLCPQVNDTYTHTNDILCVVKDVVLPTANSLDFQFRISGSDEVTLQLASDGSLLLLDNAVTEISAGAATVSDGDDVVLVLEGADGEVFVAGTSVGTTSTIAITTGTAGKRSDSTDAACDYIALFPRSLSNMPPVLIDPDVGDPGDTPDAWPGTFWNWEDDSIGDATPTGVLNQIDATFTVRDDSGATKYLKLIPAGLDVADYGYSHVISYNPAGASTQSFDLDLPSTISSGTHRFEILIGNESASASQNTFGIRIQDGYRNDTADDAVLCLLDYNTGNERGRILEYTGLQGGFASTTLLDTNTVGTYDAQNDFKDWTLCQYEINIDTGSVTYRIRNVGPNDAADTGWLTDDGTKFDNGPFSVLTVEPRNYSGNTASVAQVWYGLGSYAWPNGILNGWGS